MAGNVVCLSAIRQEVENSKKTISYSDRNRHYVSKSAHPNVATVGTRLRDVDGRAILGHFVAGTLSNTSYS